MMPPEQNLAFLTPAGGPHPDPADLSLYAMQLVSGEQAATIAEHLSGCADWFALSLPAFRAISPLAALSVDLDAPSVSARRRLLDQVAREKKIVPAAQAAQAQPDPGPQPVPSFGRSGSVLSIEERKPKRRVGLVVLTGLGWAAAAGLCLFAGSLWRDRQTLHSDMAAQAGQIDRLTADAAQAHQLMDALTDPGAMRVSMRMPATPKPQGVPAGGVTYNPQKGSLIFLASNMGPLEQYKAYELWIIPMDNSAPVPAGSAVHPTKQGNYFVLDAPICREVDRASKARCDCRAGGRRVCIPPCRW